MKQKFVQAADHVIDTYRNNESQLIYEKEWERARTMAAHALAVDPSAEKCVGRRPHEAACFLFGFSHPSGE